MSLSAPLVPTQGLAEQVLVAAIAAPLSAITPSNVIAKISSARILMMIPPSSATFWKCGGAGKR